MYAVPAMRSVLPTLLSYLFLCLSGPNLFSFFFALPNCGKRERENYADVVTQAADQHLCSSLFPPCPPPPPPSLIIPCAGNDFLGGASSPTLADVTVFGALRSLEGLATFDDMMANTAVGPWYARMQKATGEGKGTFVSASEVAH